jgi:hypothetical protein
LLDSNLGRDTKIAVLRAMAEQGSGLLREGGGTVDEAVLAVGGELLAPHMQEEQIRTYLEERGVGGEIMDLVAGVAGVGVLVHIDDGGHGVGEAREQARRYGNHKSAVQRPEFVWDNEIEEVARGRYFVCKEDDLDGVLKGRAWVSPMGVAEGKKWRLIRDLTFGVWSTNKMTVRDGIPDSLCGTVFPDLIDLILRLRKKFPGRGIYLSKMDVKSAFRQIKIDGVVFIICVGVNVNMYIGTLPLLLLPWWLLPASHATVGRS